MADKGPPGSQATDLIPWYEVAGRRSANLRIVFGHWSTLGLHENNKVFALDTGCLWGGKLTALRLDDQKIFQIQCPTSMDPKA